MTSMYLLYTLLLLGAANAEPLSVDIDPPLDASMERSTSRTLQQELEARVVNGWETSTNDDFSYVGYVRSPMECGSGVEQICAGSLIMPRVFITAGHCVNSKCSSSLPNALPGEVSTPYTEENKWPSPIRVKLNQRDISLPTNKVPGAEERIVAGAIRHPSYVWDGGIGTQGDMALMWFNTPSSVAPVELALKTTFSQGQQFQIAGWGYTDYSDPYSLPSVLRTAVVPFVPHGTCSTQYATNPSYPPVWKGNVCAGANPANFADSCLGDSGGPLMMNKTTTPLKRQLAGLTSYGYKCGNEFPGVYTNVGLQAAWIDDQITLKNLGGLETPKIKCSSHVGHRYYGSRNTTLHNIKSAGECCNAAKVTATYRHWSWHSATKRCTLIFRVEKRTLWSTWTSGNNTGTLAKGTTYCEQEHYVSYGNAGGTQLLVRYTRGRAISSAAACCNACRLNPKCRHMTWRKSSPMCTLFKGPSKKQGWARTPWNYNYISGIMSRR